ncbi:MULTISPECIES: hypothetical protein [Salipiger]|jgi:hypothetical protein|uniref:hypothetical protein n=1 Tax=Salipiger TaxID=263377 RepID=UPI000FFB4984|nr:MULTISPECIES: hypothetical protein [Salipiger]GGA05423.1 hypothetical protein GCM10011326_16310 [Salipiger profundus]
MQFTGVSHAVAPLATGHPQGLPATPDGPPAETRVQPISEQAKAGTGSNDAPGGQPEPKAHTAPPSIMQIKISALLEQQARSLQEDRRANGPDSDASEGRRPAIEDTASRRRPDPRAKDEEPPAPSSEPQDDEPIQLRPEARDPA